LILTGIGRESCKGKSRRGGQYTGKKDSEKTKTANRRKGEDRVPAPRMRDLRREGGVEKYGRKTIFKMPVE